MRVFVGIFPPKEVKDECEKFQKLLKELPWKIKLVEPQNLHITITFLGYVPQDEVQRSVFALRKIISTRKKFEVSMEGLLAIPNLKSLRVVAIGTKIGKANLQAFSKLVSATLKGTYTPPHLTLARVKQVEDKMKICDFFEKHKNIKIGEFFVDKVSIVKSELTPKGPIYTILENFELS